MLIRNFVMAMKDGELVIWDSVHPTATAPTSSTSEEVSVFENDLHRRGGQD